MPLQNSAAGISINEAWDVLFRYHNQNKHQKSKGYTKGEKILIKINQGTSRWLLTQEDKDNGYYYPETFKPTALRGADNYGATETDPYIVLELLRELVNESGYKSGRYSGWRSYDRYLRSQL